MQKLNIKYIQDMRYTERQNDRLKCKILNFGLDFALCILNFEFSTEGGATN